MGFRIGAPTQRECARMLRRAGFSIVRHKGDHAIYGRGGRRVVLPTGHPTRQVSPVVWRSVRDAVGA